MPATFRMRQLAVLMLSAMSLFALLSLSALPSANALTRTDKVRDAVRVAAYQKGDPYQYGSDGPDRFDCSGLTYFAFHKRAGFSGFPRTSGEQAQFVRHIRRSNMRRGDLIFFTDGGHVYHVGIFAGWRDGHRIVLHAPHTGARVRTERLWTNSWFPGTMRY
jgi:cell wall-associated NlpC family hydrolase